MYNPRNSVICPYGRKETPSQVKPEQSQTEIEKTLSAGPWTLVEELRASYSSRRFLCLSVGCFYGQAPNWVYRVEERIGHAFFDFMLGCYAGLLALIFGPCLTWWRLCPDCRSRDIYSVLPWLTQLSYSPLVPAG